MASHIKKNKSEKHFITILRLIQNFAHYNMSPLRHYNKTNNKLKSVITEKKKSQNYSFFKLLCLIPELEFILQFIFIFFFLMFQKALEDHHNISKQRI